jgi:hypothetical protein
VNKVDDSGRRSGTGSGRGPTAWKPSWPSPAIAFGLDRSEGKDILISAEGVAVIGLITTLLGTLGGSLGATALFHHYARRREIEAHNRDKKEEAYEEFSALMLLPRKRRVQQENYPLLLSQAFSKIDLYAPKKVKIAANRVVRFDGERKDVEDSEKLQTLTQRFEAARGKFFDLVKEDLEITGKSDTTDSQQTSTELPSS